MACPRVYPRTGGGNMIPNALDRFEVGLSPHGRGKPSRHAYDQFMFGSIPARAGETGVCRGRRQGPRVYPRTGGGNHCALAQWASQGGLSPHGRGKLVIEESEIDGQGSIPARAGETALEFTLPDINGVYPRTGGGNSDQSGGVLSHVGLSPHGRGKLERIEYRNDCTGSIPARAGETFLVRHPRDRAWVYPRTGGGNIFNLFLCGRDAGLSPHGRGKR